MEYQRRLSSSSQWMDDPQFSPTGMPKRFKRFRSRRHQIRESSLARSTPNNLASMDTESNSDLYYDKRNEEERLKQLEVKEMIFLRDLHFGFLPDEWEEEFKNCFEKIATDDVFAWKCLKIALTSRNEDLVRVILDHLDVTRRNFHVINASFVDALVLEAVELDDLESIEGILSWRDLKAKQIGLTDVDKRLLMMQKKAQEVIMTAAIRNNYSIVKILHGDGYRIFEKLADDRFFFSEDAEYFDSDDVMERHIDRIRVFKAVSSPAYMSLTYGDNPVDHAFDYSKKAALGIRREPEFRSEFEVAQQKCRIFAVSLLDGCRNSSEVELVLDDTLEGCGTEQGKKKKSKFKRLYRALFEDQKEFVAHSYCQLLLHHRWTGGIMWASKNIFQKVLHLVFLLTLSPVLCLLYVASPYRDHKSLNIGGYFPIGLLRPLDCPLNRFILDVYSYILFLTFLLLSVVRGVGNMDKTERTWYFDAINIWVGCFLLRIIRNNFQYQTFELYLDKGPGQHRHERVPFDSVYGSLYYFPDKKKGEKIVKALLLLNCILTAQVQYSIFS